MAHGLCDGELTNSEDMMELKDIEKMIEQAAAAREVQLFLSFAESATDWLAHRASAFSSYQIVPIGLNLVNELQIGTSGWLDDGSTNKMELAQLQTRLGAIMDRIAAD